MWHLNIYNNLIAEIKLFSFFDVGDRISYISINQNNIFYESGLYTLLFFVVSLLILATGNNMTLKPISVEQPLFINTNRNKNTSLILYATCISLSCLLFMNALVRLDTNVSIFLISFAFCVILTLLLIIYLKEKSSSEKNKLQAVVNEQLKKELEISNVSLLKNELEPHFIFNSLIALSHLIKTNPDTANEFNYNLAFVYKYFLLNKNKNIISLDKELELVEKYFYLIQIRFENIISLNINLDYVDQEKHYVIPCTLQILIENAIKHNSFDANNPLQIKLTCQNNYLVVTNNVKSKPLNIASTGIGLKNIITRYELIAKKNVLILNDKNQFKVKVPIIKQEHV